MFSFSKPNTPAAKSHMDAQLSLCTEMAKNIFNSIQKINELNMQVAQTMMEESVNSSKQLLTAEKPTEFLSIMAAQAQPAAEKVRAYQQHLTNIVAGAQVDLAKTAEQHVPETSRTAAAFAEEVAKNVSEETEKATQRQQAAIEKITSPINKSADEDDTLHQASRPVLNKSPSPQQANGKNA